MSDCPDGKMDRAKMKEMFSSLAPAVSNLESTSPGGNLQV